MTQSVAVLRSMGGIVFDAIFEETHASELEVTDNPVETGVTVSDHAFMRPLRLSLVGGVSDTPLQQAPGDPFASDAGRSKRAYELLTELQRKAEPFDVQTGLKLYSNMVCERINTSQDKDTANVLFFYADLREVIIVNTETVTYPPRKPGPTARQSGPTRRKGEQQSKVIKPAISDADGASFDRKELGRVPERNASFAKNLTDGGLKKALGL